MDDPTLFGFMIGASFLSGVFFGYLPGEILRRR
jgi:hypothetical protein